MEGPNGWMVDFDDWGYTHFAGNQPFCSIQPSSGKKHVEKPTNIHVYTNIESLADHHIIPIVLRLQNTKKTIGDGSKPYPPSEHQNSW